MLEKLTIPALRATGNPEDAELADDLAKRVERRGDFPLSDGASKIKAEKSPVGLLEQAIKEFREEKSSAPRFLGSRSEGRLVFTCVGFGRRMDVYMSLHPQDSLFELGWSRSEGTKKV